MKFSLALAALVGFASAAPTPTEEDTSLDPRTIEKRATISDKATIGYATQNGGTTGGSGGTVTTVSTLAQFTAAAGSSAKSIIVVKGTISGATSVKVASNKSIIGAKGAKLTGVGIIVKSASNVIIRNLIISKVKASSGDAIAIQKSTNVWIDHVDVSSDLNNGKDYYDGLLDFTHAADYVTVSYSKIHDHYKASLVGHSDDNGSEDTGHLHITYANNYWSNIGSRTPSIRFGTGHIFNNYYYKVTTSGINTREKAQVLVESSVFESSATEAITSLDSDVIGYAVVSDVALGGSKNNAKAGTLKSVPYSYTKLGSGKVKASVTAEAGAILSF